MLDEHAVAMNSKETTELLDILIQLLKRSPSSVIITDYDLKFIMLVCERLTVMNMGRPSVSELPTNITNHTEVILLLRYITLYNTYQIPCV